MSIAAIGLNSSEGQECRILRITDTRQTFALLCTLRALRPLGLTHRLLPSSDATYSIATMVHTLMDLRRVVLSPDNSSAKIGGDAKSSRSRTSGPHKFRRKSRSQAVFENNLQLHRRPRTGTQFRANATLAIGPVGWPPMRLAV